MQPKLLDKQWPIIPSCCLFPVIESSAVMGLLETMHMGDATLWNSGCWCLKRERFKHMASVCVMSSWHLSKQQQGHVAAWDRKIVCRNDCYAYLYSCFGCCYFILFCEHSKHVLWGGWGFFPSFFSPPSNLNVKLRMMLVLRNWFGWESHTIFFFFFSLHILLKDRKKIDLKNIYTFVLHCCR